MNVATRELLGFCDDVDAVLGATLASEGFVPNGTTLGLERAECDYRGEKVDLRFYYFRPDGEVNCLIRDRSEETPNDWRYLTKYLNWGADLTDEELAGATDTGDASIRGSLRFYETLLEGLG